MARRRGSNAGLISAALSFLRKANKRNRPGRLPAEQRDHLFRGKVAPTGHPRVVGYHYRPGGRDFPDRRVVPGSINRPTAGGPYEAKPQILDRSVNPPVWRNKTSNGGYSTFFPDHWTPAQVDAAIPGAFARSTPVPAGTPGGTPALWRGEYRGVQIEGWYLKDANGHFVTDSAGNKVPGNGWPLL
ncbi:hypothetical protein J2S43_002854 [Catenuloplanes nepalensis]|uniref:Bacterial EndoU nuclease domain-containing protein n=1 Tax=Catenuloplanes nepalensis TaxID=587533 RepID=A0ABT9MSD9_9ACTN|nr:EndoU domain-containing protein [Catenuloplanes nepalensis]MDP9794342.1 hypothetical protein [Catenuloplanes nepalensis]